MRLFLFCFAQLLFISSKSQTRDSVFFPIPMKGVGLSIILPCSYYSVQKTTTNSTNSNYKVSPFLTFGVGISKDLYYKKRLFCSFGFNLVYKKFGMAQNKFSENYFSGKISGAFYDYKTLLDIEIPLLIKVYNKSWKNFIYTGIRLNINLNKGTGVGNSNFYSSSPLDSINLTNTLNFTSTSNGVSVYQTLPVAFDLGVGKDIKYGKKEKRIAFTLQYSFDIGNGAINADHTLNNQNYKAVLTSSGVHFVRFRFTFFLKKMDVVIK